MLCGITRTGGTSIRSGGIQQPTGGSMTNLAERPVEVGHPAGIAPTTACPARRPTRRDQTCTGRHLTRSKAYVSCAHLGYRTCISSRRGAKQGVRDQHRRAAAGLHVHARGGARSACTRHTPRWDPG